MSSPATPRPSRREAVDALLMRLSRLHASAVTLDSTAGDLRDDGAPTSLLAVLNDIDRDLLLAARETARIRSGVAP